MTRNDIAEITINETMIDQDYVTTERDADDIMQDYIDELVKQVRSDFPNAALEIYDGPGATRCTWTAYGQDGAALSGYERLSEDNSCIDSVIQICREAAWEIVAARL